MPSLQPGANLIFTSTAGSTAKFGEWYAVGNLTELTVHAVLAASTVGATAGSTVSLEVSNTGSTAYPLATKGRTIALTCTTDVVADGGSLQSSMVGAWKFVRVAMTSLTTSTAGSAGSPSVNVYVNARQGR